MQKPFTETIEVSPAFGEFLTNHYRNISVVLTGSSWTTHSYYEPHLDEIKVLLDRYGFHSVIQLLAYLLSSQNFTIKEKRYRIQLIESDEDSYVYQHIELGRVFIGELTALPWYQTIFTQKEIDADPKLKQFEKWKIEVD